ncbi:MAG: hypothetical protein WC962_08345, partial [Phycisphaerae bacterium]
MPKATLPQLNAAYLKDFMFKLFRRTPPSNSTAIVWTGINTNGTMGSGGDDLDGLYAPIALSYATVDDESAVLTGARQLVEGTNINFTDTGAGGTLTIDCTATPDDHKVMATAADTTPGYLVSKTSAGDGITFGLVSPGGNEKVSIAAEWKDDGSNTLIPVTANDNVLIDGDPG